MEDVRGGLHPQRGPNIVLRANSRTYLLKLKLTTSEPKNNIVINILKQ